MLQPVGRLPATEGSSVKITFLSRDPESQDDGCPSLYDTDRGTCLVRGWRTRLAEVGRRLTRTGATLIFRTPGTSATQTHKRDTRGSSPSKRFASAQVDGAQAGL